jgi:hypothetical protein
MTHIVITTTETGVQHIGPFDASADAAAWLQDRGITGLVVPLIGLKGEFAMPEGTMQFGKYRGRTIASVIRENPQYIVWAYKNAEGHGGISEEQYRRAGGTPLPKDPYGSSLRNQVVRPPAARDFSDDFADDDIPF